MCVCVFVFVYVSAHVRTYVCCYVFVFVFVLFLFICVCVFWQSHTPLCKGLPPAGMHNVVHAATEVATMNPEFRPYI